MIDKKLFKKTYPFICLECGKFAYHNSEYCEVCGSYQTVREATKNDYKKKFKND